MAIWRSTWGRLLLAVYGLSAAFGAGLALFFWRARERAEQALALRTQPPLARWLLPALALLMYTAFLFAIWTRVPGTLLSGLGTRLALFWWVAVAGMLAVRALRPARSWPAALLDATVPALIGVQLVSALRWVNDFPFSLGWSEGSYIFYASLVASRKLYGQAFPLSLVYPTRALLESIPFLIGQFPLWAHRLWSALLTIGITALTSLLLARRFDPGGRRARCLLAGLTFLFLMQAGVKFELQVSLILVLLLVRRGRMGLALAGVALASFWGGLSRLNWFVVPAALALTLYLLEERVSARGPWAYIGRGTALVVTGAVFGVAGLACALRLSGMDWAIFLSQGTARSFWYRLWPSPVYPPGVIPAAVALSLPVWVLLARAWRAWLRELHLLRWLGLWMVLLALFLGGLLVSSKIGGGADLHNMDAYFSALLIVGAAVAAGGVETERRVGPVARPAAGASTALAALIQAAFVLYGVWPYQPLDHATAARALAQIRAATATAAREGEVLFICQRQLLATGLIRDVPLVREHELVELAAYVNLVDYPRIDAFQEDIQARRFRMIVAYTQRDQIQGLEQYFAEENNLWVDHVSRTVLCYYEPALEFPELDLVVYVPAGGETCKRK